MRSTTPAAREDRGQPSDAEGRSPAWSTGSGRDSARGFERLLLPPGSSLDRYAIEGLLGAGGMGVVYAAYDPKLDRKVALKMVRPSSARQGEAHERLWHEARTMARLSHPNVVAVYDVGVHDGQLFLAMEHVDGVTLRAWLRRATRPVGEVLGAFLQAGRGLSAAHAAGLVHRDFKPDNVLVDQRGRVRVTDFGLARESGVVAEPAPHSTAGTHDVPVTRTGNVLGTPAYMAPELHLGRGADAQSDQFSFCVALYEALYGHPPFEGVTGEALAEAVTGGRRREPAARAGVSPRLQRAIARGLRVEPGERFATMGDLLAALAVDPAARRRRALALGGAVVGLAAVAAGAQAVRHDGRPTCQGADREFERVWGGGRQAAVREALLGTGKVFAADAWRGVERALDAYARDWAAAKRDACEATHVRGDQSPALLDVRVACLDERREAADALVRVLAQADADVAEHAVGAALALPPLAPCADRRALLAHATPPPEPAVRARREALAGALARAKALGDAGKYREARALATECAAEAETLGERALLGRALLERGVVEGRLGAVTEGEATLGLAMTVADVAGDDETRARASYSLLFNVGVLQVNGALVPLLNEQAKAAVARFGGDPGLDGLRGGNFAMSLVRQGKLDEAVREFHAALPQLERAFGPESRQVQGLYANLAEALCETGDYEGGEVALSFALDLARSAFGEHNPDVVVMQSNLGELLVQRTNFERAMPLLERALAAEERLVGVDAPKLWIQNNSVGYALLSQGQYRRALPYAERALALAERIGPDFEDLLFPLTLLGEVYVGLGEPRRALPHLERAVRLRTYPQVAASLAEARFALARALWSSGGERRRARQLAAAARDAYAGAVKSPLNERQALEVERWLSQHGPDR